MVSLCVADQYSLADANENFQTCATAVRGLAQSSLATVNGVVSDPAMNVVPNAEVRAHSQ
jgi:hypothetical protein